MLLPWARRVCFDIGVGGKIRVGGCGRGRGRGAGWGKYGGMVLDWGIMVSWRFWWLM